MSLQNPPIPTPRPTTIFVPSSTPNSQITNGTFNGTPDGQAREIRQKTPYNWVELVFKAFGRDLPTKPKEVALLVIREAKLGGRGEASGREKSAAAGETSTTAIARAGATSKVAFDDLLYLVWTENDAGRKQCVEVFRCTADPGTRGVARGTAMQIEGNFYSCTPVAHCAKKYGSAISALRIRNMSNKVMIRIARDARRRYNVYTNVESAQVEPGWRFCGDERHDSVGVNMHFGGAGSASTEETRMVAGWSIGCTTLAWGKNSKRYKTDFLKRCTSAPNKNDIPYLVVSSKYIKTFDIWRTERSGGNARPQDIIKESGLEKMPGGIAGYVPSIATKGFCEQVLALANKVGGTRGANLKASLQNLAITTLKTGGGAGGGAPAPGTMATGGVLV